MTEDKGESEVRVVGSEASRVDPDEVAKALRAEGLKAPDGRWPIVIHRKRRAKPKEP